MILIDQNNRMQQALTTLHYNSLSTGYAKCDTRWKSAHAYAYSNLIYMVTTGTATLNFDNNISYQMRPGHIYFIAKNTPFTFSCPEYMEKLYFKIDILNNYNEVLAIAPCGCLELYDREAQIKQMLELYRSHDYQSAIKLQGMLYELMAEVMERTGCTADLPNHSPLIDRALHHIADNLNLSQSADTLAKRLNTSPSILRTHFKAEIGIPLGKYLRHQILEAAANDIINTHLTLKEISDKYGFYDQFHFSRVFTERIGIPPSKYRKKEII